MLLRDSFKFFSGRRFDPFLVLASVNQWLT